MVEDGSTGRAELVVTERARAGGTEGERSSGAAPGPDGTSAERHARVGSLFKKARRLEPEARAEFLSAACGGAPELRREVESLPLTATRPG